MDQHGNCTFPCHLKREINHWSLVDYEEINWCKLFDGKSLQFRKGVMTYQPTPQWERLCETVEMTLDEFFKISRKNMPFFLYYDYKYISHELSTTSLSNNIQWADVGLVDVDGQDSTLWIGNKGAHSPCHQDCYGYNVVAQLYGRKRWLLFPPSTKGMHPTRVPYEESSIYSKINFYSPTNQILDIPLVYEVVLEPGDLLYVPRLWWHYVENLEVAINVNTWVPVDEDAEMKVEEALVQKFVSLLCQDLPEEQAIKLVNPNQQVLNETLRDDILMTVVDLYRKRRDGLTESPIKETGAKMADWAKHALSPMTREKLQNFIETKASELNYDPSFIAAENVVTTPEILINSFCNSETIRLVKDKFLESMDKRK